MYHSLSVGKHRINKYLILDIVRLLNNHSVLLSTLNHCIPSQVFLRPFDDGSPMPVRETRDCCLEDAGPLRYFPDPLPICSHSLVGNITPVCEREVTFPPTRFLELSGDGKQERTVYLEVVHEFQVGQHESKGVDLQPEQRM
jgi:hypothetical protein